MAFVDIGEGGATHRAGVDEVEGISAQLCWSLLRHSAHDCGCDDVERGQERRGGGWWGQLGYGSDGEAVAVNSAKTSTHVVLSFLDAVTDDKEQQRMRGEESTQTHGETQETWIRHSDTCAPPTTLPRAHDKGCCESSLMATRKAWKKCLHIYRKRIIFLYLPSSSCTLSKRPAWVSVSH